MPLSWSSWTYEILLCSAHSNRYHASGLQHFRGLHEVSKNKNAQRTWFLCILTRVSSCFGFNFNAQAWRCFRWLFQRYRGMTLILIIPTRRRFLDLLGVLSLVSLVSLGSSEFLLTTAWLDCGRRNCTLYFGDVGLVGMWSGL